MATTMVHVACRSRAGAGCSLSVSTPRRLGLARDRRASLIRRKAGSENEDGSTRSEEDIELMEARLGIGRKGREAKAQPQAAQRKAEPEQSVGPNSSVKWEEGSVFPEGWEEMDLKQKVVQGLYGERGFLYWLNWLSYRLVFVMIGGWITFRFIGPALHLYNLTNPFDISQVPL